jgi:Type VI secretion system/phage-baseplate injector OB domain
MDFTKLYVGIVEDISDPKRVGRIKVRVQSIFEDIPLEDIPWAQPYKSLAGKGFGLPAVGKLVNILFSNNNIYEPLFIYSENYNINLEEQLQEYSDEEYEGFIALLFDHRTQIYSDDDNLTLDYKYNKITIDNSSINLELKDNQQKINIGTKDASQQAMLGNHWLDWFDSLVKTLQKPTSLMGNLGAPVIRPELDAVLVEYWVKRETFISDHVFITDDFKIKKLK